MPFKRTFSPVLDEQTFETVNAAGSKVSLTFEVGDYPVPFWIDVENGPTLKVGELPFRTVLEVPA